MSKSNKLLNEFSSGDSKFFELRDGEEKKVKFLFVEEVPNEFNGGKDKILRYHIEENGKEKLWDRSSKLLARQMEKIPEGTWIAIRRVGQGKETRYFVSEAQK